MNSELFKNLQNIPRPTHVMIGEGHKTGDLPHFHSLSELIYVREGGLSIATPDSVYPVSEGDIVLTSGGTPHSTIDTIFPITFIVCYLKFVNILAESDITKHLYSYHSANRHIVHVFKAGSAQNQFIGNLMEKLLEEQVNQREHHTEMINSYFNLINLFLLREKIVPESLPNINDKTLKKVLPILEYINNNYNSALNLKDVSSLFFLSRSHFQNIFKSATNMSFTEYINYVRIQKSKKLIKNASKSIGEISRDVGFSSQIYFCRCFKKFNLCTPTEYRQRNISSDIHII